MKHCLRMLVVLVWMLQMACAHAAYKCVSELPTQTKTGSITTGISVLLTFDLYCTRLSSDSRTNALNKLGVQYSILNTDVSTSAGLRNTVGTTTWELPITVALIVPTNSNSNNLSTSLGAANPACATAGAPSALQAWIYSQTPNNSNPVSTSLQFATTSSLTTTRNRYLKVCLYVPPPTQPVPSGTYSRTMKLSAPITSVVNNLVGGSDPFTVSVDVSHPCAIGSPDGTQLAIAYTSFASSSATASLRVNANCPGFWSADLSAPTTGELRGIAYELGLSTSSAVSLTGFLSTSLTNQSGVKDIYIHGRAASGQVGSVAPCGSSCSAPHQLTITY